MDLRELEVKDVGAKMYVRHPGTGEKLTHEMEDGTTMEMYMLLLGHDSKQYRDKARQITNGRIKEKRDNPTYITPPDRVEDEAMELLASIVMGGQLFIDGQVMELNSTNVLPIFQKYVWIREQVDTFVHNRNNFL